MKTLTSIVLVIISSLGGANAKVCDSVQALEWMLGDWQMHTKTSVIGENWVMLGSDLMSASGTTTDIATGDQTVGEVLRIMVMGEQLFYFAKPNKADQPTVFKATQCSDNSVRFENPAHDFPQMIRYELINSNKLRATVSSKDNPGFVVTYSLPEE